MLKNPTEQETEGGVWATACKELGGTHNCMSLEFHSSPVKF